MTLLATLFRTGIIILVLLIIGSVRILSVNFLKVNKKSGRARTYTRNIDNDEEEVDVRGDGKTDIRDLNYKRKDSIMTPTELLFYRNLTNVLGNKYLVFSKVNLWEIVQNVENKGWYYIAQKHIDFVLSSPFDGKTILAIELDDASHNTQRAKKSDEVKNIVLQKAGVPLLRIDVSAANDPRAIQVIVGNKLREVFRM